MTRGKKIFSIITLLYLLIFSIWQSNTQNNDSDKVLESRAPTPTLVYTPSVTRGVSMNDTPTPRTGEIYTVEKVIDGDTINVSLKGVNSTLRLIGINTPESVDPRRPVECFANEASNKAKELLLGQEVYLEEDPTQGSRDKYNRLLRYVIRTDGLFFNHWMIENGYAYEYTYDTPYKHRDAFLNAQKTAQEANAGLWADTSCNGLKKGLALPTFPDSDNKELVDMDCSNFTTQTQAQDFFNSQGGPELDPHKMDSDRDGTVCESLP